MEKFTPPRHWIGPEELESSYWSDPKVLERRSQEFYDKPLETVSLIDRLDTKGIARRDFLTIMGASMALAGTACARRPIHKIIPYVVQPEEITPGVSNYYASTCAETGVGLLIKTREARPIKLEGNPKHPMGFGSLSARGQASILDLYDPERLKEPMVRPARGQAGKVTSWTDVDADLGARIRKAGGKVRLLTQRVHGDATRKLISEFLGGNTAAHVEFEPLFASDVTQGQAEAYGTAVVPGYRFDEAGVVVSVGNDFLGTASNHGQYERDWVKNRKLSGKPHANAIMSKLFVFESTMTVTGANSDERTPIRPGDELKIAAAIARELGVAVPAGYTADAVAGELGISADSIKEAAKALSSHRGNSIFIAGGSIHSRSQDAIALQIVAAAINSALGNEGKTVDGTADVDSAQYGYARMARLIAEINAGVVDVLIIHRANPAFSLPKAAGFEAALAKVATVAVISDREDETAKWADFVLADHHPFENWGDSHPRKNLWSIQQPVIEPLHKTRSLQECLLAWRGATVSWHDYVRNFWRDTVYREARASGTFDSFWERALRDGVIDTLDGRRPSASGRSFRSAALAQVPAYKPAGEGFKLALYETVALHDGRNANNAWLMEMPDPISTVTWDNYLNVGPATAKQLKLSQDDVVEISLEDGTKAELAVNIQPGMHPQAVSVGVGYGRRSVGKVGDGAGVDVYPFVRVAQGQLVFSGMDVKIRKTGKFYRLAAVQWHHAVAGEAGYSDRPIVNDITLGEFKKNPAAEVHADPHLRMKEVPTMWGKHEYKGYRWGMSIDLNSCTGCGACVIACQAENNIPVVGRNNVRVSRQMHWIKIDRYYSGPADSPDVIFSPMLCQHCENAPCETVCPVLATVHDDEGTNNQVYNRCVGTRYCANNCPYKVRRFNFFDHWKNYEGTANLVWNPDVTVRSRGIMEKCSFCIQRINKGKMTAKAEGRLVRDGEIKAACQQTCPTEAIVFGNINDKASQVAKLQADPLAFRSLEILNTRPAVSYLSKVRNKAAKAHAPGGHGEGHEGGGHHG